MVKDSEYVCRCECGGMVRGVRQFGMLFTWCVRCTPKVVVNLKKLKPSPKPAAGCPASRVAVVVTAL